MSDIAMNINECVARQFGGKYLQKRYIDIIQQPQEIEDRDVNEIINNVLTRAGIEVREESELV